MVMIDLTCHLWLAFILARYLTLSTPVMNNSIAVMKYLCGRTWPPPRTRQQMKRRFNFITLSASSVLLDLTFIPHLGNQIRRPRAARSGRLKLVSAVF